jgi:hypothetical protein
MTTGTSGYPLAALPFNEALDPWIRAMLGIHPLARRQVMKRKFTPPMAWLLYKYLPAGREHSLTNLHDILVRSLLRLSSPSQFNDPFEMAAHFSLKSTEAQRLARFESLAREQEPLRGWGFIRAWTQSLMSTPESQLAPVLAQSLSRIRDAAGIYSFAGDARNTLTWSHYASDHKGVCLIFDRAHDIATLSHAFRVKYVRNLPVLNWIRSFHKDISKMLFAKHPAWRYEHESRIMINDQAGRYLPFAPRALRGLIFGCRAEPQFMNAVERILSDRAASAHPPVHVYFAQTHPTKYRLVIKREAPGTHPAAPICT